MANHNPWRVESIKAFYYLKCPECKYDSKEESTFEDHAIENHPMSYELFGKNKVLSYFGKKKSVKAKEFDSVMIKEEEMSGFSEKETNCEPFDFCQTEMVDLNDSRDFCEVKKEPVDDNFSIEDHSNLKNQIAYDHEGQHFMSVHEEKKPYKCSYSDIGEVKKELIDEHFVSEDYITSDYEENKPFVNSHCEEGFTTSADASTSEYLLFA